LREDLIAGIEGLAERKVLSFMSDRYAGHDYAAEIFVLDGPPRSYVVPEEPPPRGARPLGEPRTEADR